MICVWYYLRCTGQGVFTSADVITTVNFRAPFSPWRGTAHLVPTPTICKTTTDPLCNLSVTSNFIGADSYGMWHQGPQQVSKTPLYSRRCPLHCASNQRIRKHLVCFLVWLSWVVLWTFDAHFYFYNFVELLRVSSVAFFNHVLILFICFS